MPFWSFSELMADTDNFKGCMATEFCCYIKDGYVCRTDCEPGWSTDRSVCKSFERPKAMINQQVIQQEIRHFYMNNLSQQPQQNEGNLLERQ